MNGTGGQLSDFGEWWKDPKKHYKRLYHWLPYLRQIDANLGGRRSLRYFTLCARAMIDVFMLVENKLLRVDGNSRIHGVQFCECNPDYFIEIRDILAREDSGFFGMLERVALFGDTDYTAQFATLADIAHERAAEGEGLRGERDELLREKETSLMFQQSFPYDFVNLDFCGYYYSPPEVFRITETVTRFLEWQSRTGAGAEPVVVNDFILSVTCRYDARFPKEAEAFLADIVRANCVAFAQYAELIRTSRAMSVDGWIALDGQDLFLAAWPKHVAESASKIGWKTEVVDYVYYERTDAGKGPYIIVCLVARFTREASPDYLPAALYALEEDNRKLIPEISQKSAEGRKLLENLERIRRLRNEVARKRGTAELPDIVWAD